MDPWTQPPTQAFAQQDYDTAAQSQNIFDPMLEESDEQLLDALFPVDTQAPTLTWPGLDNSLTTSQPRQLNEGEASQYAPMLQPPQYAPLPQSSTLQLNDAQFRQSSEQLQSFAPEPTGCSLPLPDESLQPNDYAEPAHFPDALQFCPSATAWTASQPLQLAEQSQSVPSQAPGHSLPLLDGTDLQNNTASNHHVSTNQLRYDTSSMHQNMLSHGHDQPWGDFNTTSDLDPRSQQIPSRNNIGLSYDPISGVCPTHTPSLAASDLPLLPDFPQPQNPPNPFSDNSQDGCGYNPITSQVSTVPAMYGPWSQNAYGRWPQTSDQMSQYRSQKFIASQPTSSQLIGSDSSTSFPYDILQDMSQNMVTVMPFQAGSASEYPTFHAPSSSHAPNAQGRRSANLASSCVGRSVPLQSRKAIRGSSRKVANTSLVAEGQQKTSSATVADRHRKLEQKLTWCPSLGSTSKQGQSQATKRLHNNYGRNSKACYWCKVKQKRCDGPNKTLCNLCERYIRNLYGSQFRLPKFTCDVRTKFAEIDLVPWNVITEELNEKSLETLHRITVLSDGDEVQSFFTKLKPIFDFLDCLDPEHARQIYFEAPRIVASYFSYMQGIIRWKDFFMKFRPDLKHIILMAVVLYCLHLRSQLRWFDLVLVPKQEKEETFWFHAILYKEIPVMKLCNNANEAAIEHFRSALEHRLVFRMGDIFVAQSTKCLPEKKLINRAEAFCLLSGAPFLLPPQYREGREWCRGSWPGFEEHHKCPQEPNHSGEGIDEACICSPMMHCLPSHALICLGFDLSDIARALHNDRKLLDTPLSQIFQQILCSPTGKSYAYVQRLFRQIFMYIIKAFIDELTAGNLFLSKPNVCPVFSPGFFFQFAGRWFLKNVLLSSRHILRAITQGRNPNFEMETMESMGGRIIVEDEKAEAYKQLRGDLRQIVRKLRDELEEGQERHGYCEGNCDWAMALKRK
ncbi:hypothetical protein FB567DRAFT_247261 [Paraphoma chrysanthemicola]|uniref:Uncharacterized protein n=1 Tax=Paraphoma chrysanthemicola TaxID=798071 RepID=A0A8K0QSV4_9PLEO|nr:hypothetical protein FB567DRAFT_247261 [Paraphoma chrysanthemicola]